jgi:hypothetical protein
MAVIVGVAWKRKKEWRTIKAVLTTKLQELLRGRLISKNCDSWVAGNQFNEECDK